MGALLSRLAPILPEHGSKIKSSCILVIMSAKRISRRGFLAFGLAALIGTPAAAAGKTRVTVYKGPT
jgi:hypothetical protein